MSFAAGSVGQQVPKEVIPNMRHSTSKAEKHYLRDAEILHLLDGHLTSESTAALEVAILRGDERTIGELVRAV